jgi:hypothetical protein
VPAAALASVGAVLAVLQPGPSVMDLLGWVWPVALGVLAIWMFGQLRRELHGVGRWLVGGPTRYFADSLGPIPIGMSAATDLFRAAKAAEGASPPTTALQPLPDSPLECAAA